MRATEPVILLVDDDEETYNLYSDFLASSGFSVIGASDGEEAVRVAQRLSPSLIVMDLGLPLLDGCEATRKLRSDPRTRHIPILAMTGFVQRHIVEMARQAGCDAFLAKPCPLDRLLSEAQRLCGPHSDTPPPPDGSSRILVVEDDDEIREAMVLVLEQQGYSVYEARNGREALELLHDGETPRLILLDLMMPVMDGWQFRHAHGFLAVAGADSGGGAVGDRQPARQRARLARRRMSGQAGGPDEPLGGGFTLQLTGAARAGARRVPPRLPR